MCLEHWWMPRAGLSFMALQTDRSIPIDWSVGADQHSRGVHPQSVDCARSFRVIVESTNALVGALVDASGRAELYGTTDRSIDPDRLVCRSRINILEASTPNLLIVQLVTELLARALFMTSMHVI
jgi:hypothetical protein